MKKVIIISAHPDDEVLGGGGTLLKHIENGDQVYWLITTNISRDQGFDQERVQSRQNEIKEVEKKIGIKETFLLNYPTMQLTSSSIIDMVPKISKIFTEVKPEVIYCLNRSEVGS